MEGFIALSAQLPFVAQAECADVAAKLAASMIGVMNFIGELTKDPEARGHGIVWKTPIYDDGPSHHSPWKSSVWQADVQRKPGIIAPWTLRVFAVTVGFDQKVQEKHLIEELTAGLTLWLYSLRCGLEYNQKDTITTATVHNGVSPSGVSVSGGRIIGSESSSLMTPEMLRYFGLPLSRHAPGNLSRAEVGGQLPTYSSKWPIFGLYYSSFLT